MDIQPVVIYSDRIYHRGTWDYEDGGLTLHAGVKLNGKMQRYTELPEDVLVEELCDRCFPRGE